MSDFLERIKNLSPKRLALLAMDLQSKLEKLEQAHHEPIAVIGLGCRFPGAENPAAFWRLLREGGEALREVPRERWDLDAYYDPDPEAPGKINTRHGGFLERVDLFDPLFFGISAREAVSMDPQQRLLLEVTWEALEHAGLAAEAIEGSATGVFLGICSTDYPQLLLGQGRETFDAYLATGSSHAIASGRLSYLLGVHGPSVSIDTACSSSLVAVHEACLHLRAGDCRMALAGGVNVMLTPDTTITLSKARMMAPDGRCKTFDASANGFVRGEGCGMIVLKRLRDALADRDNVLALILGSAVNQDGRSSGLTAPNGPAQEAVIRAALEAAGLAPAAIGYVETHGTGTALGDPIEVNALAAVLGKDREPHHRLKIASVKTNFGHLEGAAGIAGLIKLVLALQHQQIPPHLHLTKRNPHIPWDELPIDIPAALTPWEEINGRRIGATSSFGFSGTNAHVIVAEASEQWSVVSGQSSVKPGHRPLSTNDSQERPWHLLTISAKSEEALRALALRYEQHLLQNPEQELPEVCFTANVGRSHFAHRAALLAPSPQQMRDKLRAFASGAISSGVVHGELANSKQPETVFLFTGQGAQYLNMGRRLYETQPVFRKTMDRCDEILRPYLKTSLLSVIFSESEAMPQALAKEERAVRHLIALEDIFAPENNSSKGRIVTGNEQPAIGIQQPATSIPLDQTAFTQPALFAIEYALAELWRSWGIAPAAVMGHSVGEYVAACVAGVFSLEDGLRLIAERGRLMQALPSGGVMVAIFTSEEKVAAAISSYRVAIAAINGPQHVVISGEQNAVMNVVRKLAAEGVQSKPLNVSHAFHSPLMLPMLEDFAKIVNTITFHEPKIPLISNLTAQPLELSATNNQRPATNNDPQSTIHDPRLYWCRHVREAVRFSASMVWLQQQGYRVFVEIGPSPTLLGMAGKFLPEGALVAVPSLRRDKDDWEQMLHGLAVLYTHNVSIDWRGFDRDYPRRKVVLPTYPFQRERFWIAEKKTVDRGSLIVDRDSQTSIHAPLPSAEAALQDWLYEVAWRAQPCHAADFFPKLAELARTVQPGIAQIYAENRLQIYDELLPRLDALCGAYVVQALQRLGWKFEPGAQFTLDEIMSRLRVQMRHRRLFERMLLMLAEDGVLARNGESWQVTSVPALRDTTRTMNELLAQFAACSAELTITKRCCAGLAEALRGEIDPLQLLFPEGSLAETEQLYQEAPNSKAFNLILQSALAATLANFPKARTLRVLEIGGGTGGTTMRVLPILPAERTEYVFTDIGQLFLARAAEKFKAHSFVQYKTLDIAADPESQGFAAHQFDIIIAANVLHATSDLRRTLRHAQKLLAAQGLLVLLEGTQPQRFGDLTVGLTEGWWSYSDRDLRRDYALLSANQWLELLSSTGFTEAVALPQEEARKGVLQTQAVLLARGPAVEIGRGGDWETGKLGEREIQGEASLSSSHAHASWLLLADESGVAQTLARMLEARGDTCALVHANAPRSLSLDPAQPEDFKRLLHETFAAQTLPCRGVIDLWPVDAATAPATLDELRASQMKLVGGTLHLVQAMAANEKLNASRLWIITRNAQPVSFAIPPLRGARGVLLDHDDTVDLKKDLTRNDTLLMGGINLVQSPLWGLGKVIALEHPELHCTRIDLDHASAEEAARFIFDEIQNAGAEDQIALRSSTRYVPRLVRSLLKIVDRGSLIVDRKQPATSNQLPSTIHDPLSSIFDPQSSYLITGGLAGLGLLVAKWMIEQGARHLVLMGRSAPSADAKAVLLELESLGAKIVIETADVADEMRMAEIFSRIDQTLPPLRGVIHSAGAIDDGVLLQQDWPRFEKVMRAKIFGAWNLHTLTQQRELDFFILFSTGASLIGSAGQGNHAAANMFMDVLAHHRRSLGLPALSINWGAWSEVGTVMRHERSERITFSGKSAITPAQGLQILERLLRDTPPQIGVLPVKWTEVFEAMGERKNSPFFAELLCEVRPQRVSKMEDRGSRIEDQATSNQQPATFISHLNAAPKSQRWTLLQAFVREQALKVLGLETTRAISLQRPLTELGLDSLMAVELRNALGKGVEQTLPATLLFDHPTVEALFHHLGKNVLGLESVAVEAEAAITNGKAALAEKEAELDELSEEEMAALLEERLR